ncbi:pepsin a [Plakobranchus ocellatus]|uniref:Pepsin a n=1 Tax=Plakobranchus ocellatus TaxID=259542 RepID=A0AAV4C0I0_9GAST|nr:pepsin a [Plakobranchus ocellatus]
MNLFSTAVLVIALTSVCVAHLISIRVPQVRKPIWNSIAGIPRPQWKSNIKRLSLPVKPLKQSLLRQSRRTQQPVRAERPFPKRTQRRMAGSVKLTNHKDKVYHLPIEIGTPGQKFNMALHTSYPAMWVTSDHCPSSRE